MTEQKRPGWSLKRAFADRVDARITKALATFSLDAEARARQAMDEALAKFGADLALQIEARGRQATGDALAMMEADLPPRIEARGRQATDEALAMMEADLPPRIETRARQATDEALAKISADLAELSRHIEVRAQLATVEAMSRAERNMVYDMEVRAQAMALDLHGEATRDAEAKGQMAGLDAKSYADAGLLALSRTIAATGKAVAQLSRRLDALEGAVADKQRDTDEPGDAPAPVTEHRIENANPEESVADRLSDIQSGAATALAKTLERIDDVLARQTAVVARAKSTRSGRDAPVAPDDSDGDL